MSLEVVSELMKEGEIYRDFVTVREQSKGWSGISCIR